MVPEQKQAWLFIAVFVGCVVVFLATAPIFGATRAWGVFGLCGVGALGQLVFRRKRGAGEVASDERDELIMTRVTMVAGLTSYTVVVFACMIPWFVCMVRGEKTIAIDILPFVVVTGVIGHFLARSVGVLTGYGWRSSDGEG